MIYPLSILFTTLLVLYSKWQFSDDRGLSQGKWHPYGLLARVVFGVTAYISSIYPSPLPDYILSCVINVILWDIGLNMIALKKEWDYVGEESYWDKKVGRHKWKVYGWLLAVATLFKLLYER